MRGIGVRDDFHQIERVSISIGVLDLKDPTGLSGRQEHRAVTSVEETSFSEGGSEHSDGTPIYAYQYRFTYQDQPFTGTSYRLGARAEVPKKPDPTALIEVAEALSISPSACLFVGDTGIDMAAAKAAEMIAVGVPWGFRDRAELLESGADHLIEEPAALIDLLD